MLCKVMAVQAKLGERLSLEEKMYLFRQRPDFVCLPEYFLINAQIPDFRQAALHLAEHLEYLCKLSEELGVCLVAGTVVEPDGDRLYNSSYVIRSGKVLGSYRKRKPVPGEAANGITPGNERLILDIDDVRIAVLVCGDVFYPELYSELAAEDVDLVFVPTTSPYRPDDSLSQKRMRDRVYFVDGATSALSFVVKTCGVGTIFGRPLQGRSLIAAPWGVLAQVSSPEEDNRRILTSILDLAELRDFRRKFRMSRLEDGATRIHFTSVSPLADPKRYNAPLRA